MQRWELSAFDRKHLALVSVPRPGEALVTVDSVSLNYRDNLIMANRLGAEPPLPLVPASVTWPAWSLMLARIVGVNAWADAGRPIGKPAT